MLFTNKAISRLSFSYRLFFTRDIVISGNTSVMRGQKLWLGYIFHRMDDVFDGEA